MLARLAAMARELAAATPAGRRRFERARDALLDDGLYVALYAWRFHFLAFQSMHTPAISQLDRGLASAPSA